MALTRWPWIVCQAWEEVDDDGNNKLSKRELYRALELVGIHGTPGQKLSVYRMADKDHDGQVLPAPHTMRSRVGSPTAH
jgi:hypothetical protein